MSEEFVAPVRGDVVSDETSQDRPDYATDMDTVVTAYDNPEEWGDQNPIPVYVTNPAATPELQDWTSQRVFVTEAQATQLVGARRNRTRAFVKNEGPDDIYLGREATTTSPNHSYLLSAMNDRVVELFHNSAIWAICAAGDTANVSVLEEYTVTEAQ